MFSSLAKQMENLDDEGDDDGDDQDLTEEEKKEAEQMLKGIFGALGDFGGAPGGSTDGAQQPGAGPTPDFQASMNEFEQMIKNMGMGMGMDQSAGAGAAGSNANAGASDSAAP